MQMALQGIIIGLTLAAPIGPVNIEIVRRGLRGGFLAGWLVGIGAVSADTLYCLLVLAGLAPLAQHTVVQIILWTAGAIFLAYLGYSSLRAALAKQALLTPEAGALAGRSYRTGLLMALANPMSIGFWVSIGGGLLASAASQADTAGHIAIVAGVIGGVVLWVTTLSLLVLGGRRFITDRVFRLVNVAGGLLLFGFAGWFVVQLAGKIGEII